jgi:peptidoglycan/LPS O-acetylase OafA/YrhL
MSTSTGLAGDAAVAARDRSLGYLPGLDGIRAVAVVAVLLYHAELTWIPGGFLGVEVFFVISGYLITLLLLSEHQRTGTVSLKTFWMRRARRLLPALYLLLLATTVVVSTFYRDELEALRGQVIAALTYVTNWYQIAIGQSYFAGDGRPAILQHLWSLAVEEQFYLFWPIVLLGILRLTRGRRSLAAPIIFAGAVASAVWMAVLYDPVADPSRVYYGTDTRLSGLLLGAVLAFFWKPGTLKPRPPVLVDGAGALALVGLVLCFVRIDEFDPFLYRGGFVLVSVLTLVLIGSVVHPSSLLGVAAVGNALFTWVGLRSYGLYLWHWPVFVLTRPGIDVTWDWRVVLLVRFGLTLVLTELSYRLVEMPIRTGALSRWFDGLRGPADPRRDARRRLTAGLAVLGAALLVPVTTNLAGAERVAGEVEQAVVGSGVPLAAPVATTAAPTTTAVAASAPAALPAATVGSAVPTTAAPPVTVTLIGDSVLLGTKDAISAELQAAGYPVDFRGEPALMLKKAREQLEAAGTPVGQVVVIGLGYNTLWERDRANYDSWAERFDREADALLDTFTALGAERFVWVTLREPTSDITPAKGEYQLKKYAWYFPYVNERLRLLPQRRPNVTLADWAAISGRSGITYDAIHLNTDGVAEMIALIRRTAAL